MKNTSTSISLRSATVVLALLVLSGCAGMTTREKNTAVGAAVGGVAGHIIGGGLLGTAAGAAAGGVIGHQATKK